MCSFVFFYSFANSRFSYITYTFTMLPNENSIFLLQTQIFHSVIFHHNNRKDEKCCLTRCDQCLFSSFFSKLFYKIAFSLYMFLYTQTHCDVVDALSFVSNANILVSIIKIIEAKLCPFPLTINWILWESWSAWNHGNRPKCSFTYADLFKMFVWN